jgi:fibronectin-binding autotransporter adhesin
MSNFLRSLFGPKKSNPKIKLRMQSRRLELLALEERITPATVSVSGTDVLITLGAGENITDLNTSTATAVITVNTVGSANNTLVGTPTGVTVTNNTVVIDTAAFTTFTGFQVLGSNTTNAVTVGATGIDLSAGTTANTNQTVAINLSFNSGTGTLNVNGPILPKNAGNVGLNSTTVTIAAAGDITATTGSVNITGNTITSAGDVTTTSGAITYTGAVVLVGGNVATTSTLAGGNLSIVGTLNLNALNFTANQGLGNVNAFTGAVTGSGALSLTGATVSVGTITSAGAVAATATADLTFGVITTSNSVNAKSTAGDVIFGAPVTTTAVGGFVSEATLATKATKIDNAVLVRNGANALVTGNLITTSANAVINTNSVGNITITGNVDASVSGNDLTLTASSGAIILNGAVGSSSTLFGDLNVDGANTFLASGTVNVDNLNVGQGIPFATSATFKEAVTVATSLFLDTTATGTVTFDKTITATGAAATIYLESVNGSITVTGAITGKDYVYIATTGSGSITLSGAISSDNATGVIFIESTTGNVVTSGAISTSGSLAYIEIDTVTSGNVIIGGSVSTSGGGDIVLAADNSSTATGTGNLTINGTLTTTGTAAGDIILGISNGSAAVNKAVSAGATGDVVFITTLATDAITIASGATITAGDSVGDFGAGILNLGANITAGTAAAATTAGIILDAATVNLTGAVSLKTGGTGTGADITLTTVNGAQNLTLEAIDQIVLSSVGQTTALNTVTVTNSAGVTAGAFTAAKVVLTDTTGTVAFAGSTVITNSLTTAAKAYDVSFAGTTTLFGAPVFLNTGNVSFAGNTSLISGATITGSANSTVTLAVNSNISSGGVFNIGALPTTTINDGISMVLLGSNPSTFAGVVIMAAGDDVFLNGNTLTLSGDSSATFKGDFYLYDSALNVTGKLNSASEIFLNGGTITGPSGTIGNLTAEAIGIVDPEGTLNTGVVTFNASTTYIADVLTATTASNLQGNAGFNLGGATLTLESVASGLALNNSFTIINNTAVSGGLSGTFAGLPEGATLSAKDSLGNTITFAISYVGGTGANDVTLTVTNVLIANPSAIPQPMVAGQPLLNFFTAEGAGAGGGPMVTVTIDIIPGLTTVPTYFSFFAYDVGFTGGVRVAVNELDGNDDTFEIITGPGAGGGPNVKVFQFNIRTLTFNPTPVTSFFAFNDPTFNGGVYVAGGDVTGDGIGDLLVGAGEGGGPRVQVYAGSVNGVITSSPISDFFAYSTAFTGGVVVAAGDRTGDNTCEVITGPASNGGYNIKSFNINGSGSNPALIENFFAFNDFTSIGGLSIATSYFDANPLWDLVIGTTNTQFGVILNQDYAGILANPFPGFTGAIRAGFATSGNTESALAAAGPGGGPAISVFSVDPLNRTLTQTDSLFVFDPAFTGGLFVAN